MGRNRQGDDEHEQRDHRKRATIEGTVRNIQDEERSGGKGGIRSGKEIFVGEGSGGTGQ